MATTIVTKSGSGAPTASNLVAGELAVDLTNGRLYTENSSGTVLELGLNPNGNVNVTGTVTATGTSVFASLDLSGDIDVDGTSNLDILDVDGAANFAADVTLADGADLITASAGTSNFRAGVNAGNSIASGGNYNVVVGDEAGTALTTGDGNVAVGFNALAQEDEHGLNVAIGNGALYAQNAGVDAYNTAVGYSAGFAVTTGTLNTLIGGLAGDALTTGDSNTAIGYVSLSSDTKGERAVAVGEGALFTQNFTSETNNYNTAVGYNAGYAITTGIRNVLIGGLAGDALQDADFNVGVGYGALSADTLGSGSVAIGDFTLVNQNFTSATTTYNTAVGYAAGVSVTTGIQNTLIGGLAGNALTDADVNVAIGMQSLSSDTLGSKSVAVGAYTLISQNFTSATDSFNTAVGHAAGGAVTTGVQNTLIGGLAGDAITTADNNTAVGYASLGANTTGTGNTAVGEGGGSLMTTGSKNTILGRYNGNQGGLDIRTASNNIVLSDGDGNPRVIVDSAGNFLVGKTSTGTGQGFEAQADGEVYTTIVDGLNTYHVYANSGYRFYVKPDGGIVNYSSNNVNLSDEREKKNIEPLESQWDSLKQWSLKKFHYNADDDSDNKKLGVIAQEVETHNPEVIAEFNVDDETTRMAIKEQQMMWMAIKALQEAQTRIETLEAKVAALES
jgi:hypothetical protein